MELFLKTVNSLWQVVAIGLIFGAGLPTVFALGVRLLEPAKPAKNEERAMIAYLGGVCCMLVVGIAVIVGILYIMKNFLAHDLGITLF